MPLADANGVNLFYEVHGEGPNLVLIEGIGYDLWMWYRQIPAFQPLFRTLIYDNRGVGRSDKPPGPYTHEQNADDLAAVLDHLQWKRTHVLGISMGGCIAQEFALRYPSRLDKLVLVATTFGSPLPVGLNKNVVLSPPAAVQALTPVPGETSEQRIRRAMPSAFYDPGWPDKNPREFEQIVRWRLEYPQPPEAALAQAMATINFHSEERLNQIGSPTLVLAGERDGVIPHENSRRIASKIPSARLQILEGAGHVANIEHYQQFNEAVISFLQAP